jgi:DNA-binding NarL/FixJ family response regulator
VPLDASPPRAEPQSETAPYGLIERELLVLRPLVAGRSNGEIGAELFISRKTASVHVSNILRKFGVSTLVQAAALAERAGLVGSSWSGSRNLIADVSCLNAAAAPSM